MEIHDDDIYNDPQALYTQGGGFLEPKTVKKPWGHEVLLVATPQYVMKKLFIRAGERLSVQYHERKLETLYCTEGRGRAFLGGASAPDTLAQHDFVPGMVLHITPRTVHTYEALEDLVLIECSTPEIDDVVRLRDRYGRAS